MIKLIYLISNLKIKLYKKKKFLPNNEIIKTNEEFNN